eukprot:TRINITY_DN4922_c0_g1_i1.p1 TRINITY_DN4922_c0_g1~~TRINITY_DN4922_c0_g1_i1.p1  ORF type:complete len:203 (-),score=78.23 TRINITY_DN4922_c0_g1_i1:66-674(-)
MFRYAVLVPKPQTLSRVVLSSHVILSSHIRYAAPILQNRFNSHKSFPTHPSANKIDEIETKIDEIETKIDEIENRIESQPKIQDVAESKHSILSAQGLKEKLRELWRQYGPTFVAIYLTINFSTILIFYSILEIYDFVHFLQSLNIFPDYLIQMALEHEETSGFLAAMVLNKFMTPIQLPIAALICRRWVKKSTKKIADKVL